MRRTTTEMMIRATRAKISEPSGDCDCIASWFMMGDPSDTCSSRVSFDAGSLDRCRINRKGW